jgi:two-component system chemotaxis response regulator CheY
MPLDFAMPVLVVDDYRTVVRIIRNLLRQVGFHDVDEACDGDEALSKMKARKYGLVLSDWHMAPTNGYELLKTVKADEQLRDATFIMISAEAAPENMAAARQAGARAYVLKPFDAQTLRARIETALQPA